MELANIIRVSSDVACVHLIGNGISLEMALIYVPVLRLIIRNPKQCLVTGMPSWLTQECEKTSVSHFAISNVLAYAVKQRHFFIILNWYLFYHNEIESVRSFRVEWTWYTMVFSVCVYVWWRERLGVNPTE